MPIQVVCPGCRKRFQVGDQFAGRTGPCPTCKTPIKIPAKGEEVVVHAPEEFGSGGKSAQGTLILKPIGRTESKFTLRAALTIGGAVLGSLLLALVVNRLGILKQGDTWNAFLLKSGALVVLSPLLVLAGYSFLRDDEMEPYEGRQLYIRAVAVASVYIVLWAVFGRYGLPMVQGGEVWMWLAVASPILLVGSMTSSSCFDIEVSSGTLLYCFYLLVTILLRGLAGGGWVWKAMAA